VGGLFRASIERGRGLFITTVYGTGATSLGEPGDRADMQAVAAAWGTMCGIARGGSVRCWGRSAFEDRASNPFELLESPPDALGINDAAAIAVSSAHGCAARRGGGVQCWGQNDSGQLGDGSDKPSLHPVAVRGLEDAVGVAVGLAFSCALRRRGSVACWGDGGRWTLGDGRTRASRTPVAVEGIGDGVQIAAGDLHACVVRRGGGVACWGWNGGGNLGAGAMTDQATPVSVVGLTDARQVAAGESHTCAVRASGEVVCWGRADNGQMGADPGLYRAQAAPVAGLPAYADPLAAAHKNLRESAITAAPGLPEGNCRQPLWDYCEDWCSALATPRVRRRFIAQHARLRAGVARDCGDGFKEVTFGNPFTTIVEYYDARGELVGATESEDYVLACPTGARPGAPLQFGEIPASCR
jgi:hypothetical protein